MTATETLHVPTPKGRWSTRPRWEPSGPGPFEGEWSEQLDPAVGRPFTRVRDMTGAEAERQIAAVRRAYDDHGPLPLRERAALLERLADAVDAAAEDLGELDSLCTGKVLGEGERTARGGAALLRYYASQLTGDPFREELEPVADGIRQVLDRVPLGLVACILPWNYPVSQACARMAMLVASGNAVLMKGSELAQPPLLALEELAREAGWPEWCCSVLTGGPEVGLALVASSRVDGVCFTGGVRTGLDVAQRSMGDLKRVVLELGGKTPNVVFADADLQQAIAGAASAAFRNQGQVCSAGSLLLVERPVFREVVEAVAERAAALRVGHQLAPGTELGPLISDGQRSRVEALVDEARAGGAEVLSGGRRPPGTGDGFFYEATVLTSLADAAAAAREEIFGPVLVAAPFDREDEVIARANSSEYGLAAAVWTGDEARASRMRDALRTGIVWINTHGPIPRNAPWGGFRLSGLGRLYGRDGLLAFTEARATYEQLRAS